MNQLKVLSYPKPICLMNNFNSYHNFDQTWLVLIETCLVFTALCLSLATTPMYPLGLELTVCLPGLKQVISHLHNMTWGYVGILILKLY